MNFRTSALALAFCVAATGVAARAADPPKSLRTLVYDVTWDSVTSTERRDSGIGGSATGKSSAAVAAPDQGTLTIDVLAATADGGLVVDAAFAGKTFKGPPVRLGLAQDGSIVSNPGTQIAPEIRRLLPMLARGMTKDHDFTAGASWTTPVPPPNTGTITYKVRQVDGTFATFDLSYTSATATPPRVDETGQATVSYDTFHVCPTKYELQARARRTLSIDVTETSDYHLVARLTSDTLSGVKPQ
jgi:hypothetical protein